MPVLNVSDADFEREVLYSEIPVLLDFYADWCGPCKAIAPLVEDLSRSYQGRVKFVKIDVDRNPASAEAFRIQSIPTIAFLHNRRVIDMIVGAVDRARLVAALDKIAGPVQSTGPELWEVDRVKDGLIAREVTPVDVRAEADFKRVHLPEAVHVPLESLLEKAAELQALRSGLALYGRTDEGLMDHAKLLSEQGLRVCVMQGGLLAWEAARLPIVKTAPTRTID
jgi:thioredoxin